MQHAPGPYAAWVSWLTAFGRGEDLPSGHLPEITVDLGPDMVERLARHVSAAFTERTQRWSDALVRDLEILHSRPHRAVTGIATILADARRRLTPLVSFSRLGKFPDALREPLAEALRESVASAQQSLEDSTRTADVSLRNAVRQNSLLPGLSQTPTRPPKGSPPRRRVILS